jgi:phosphoglycerol transferase MdoB-like AlkP superfamily enzyme
MRMRLLAALLTSGLLSACASPRAPYPSLQPRSAETIDPRVAVERPMNQRPVSAALASRLAELVAEARAGEPAFESAASEAERLAAAAGAPQSENWVAAQAALSVATAARGPTGLALGDIDALSANALRTQGGIAPNDLAAIKIAGAEVGAIDQRQADRIKAIQARLGR